MDLTQSQEQDKIIQFYLNQQIKKVEEGRLQQLTQEEEQRNKVKLQVWQLLFKNESNPFKVLQENSTELNRKQTEKEDKYKLLDQIIAKYEEKSSKLFEKTQQSNYFQKVVTEHQPETADQLEYEPQFDEYIEEDIEGDFEGDGDVQGDIEVDDPKLPPAGQLPQLQESAKPSESAKRPDTSSRPKEGPSSYFIEFPEAAKEHYQLSMPKNESLRPPTNAAKQLDSDLQESRFAASRSKVTQPLDPQRLGSRVAQNNTSKMPEQPEYSRAFAIQNPNPEMRFSNLSAQNYQSSHPKDQRKSYFKETHSSKNSQLLGAQQTALGEGQQSYHTEESQSERKIASEDHFQAPPSGQSLYKNSRVTQQWNASEKQSEVFQNTFSKASPGHSETYLGQNQRSQYHNQSNANEEEFSEHQLTEQDENQKFYQFDIKFEDDGEDKLKKFELIRRKKLQELEELKQVRQQRKGKEQRDPSPQLMPSSQASRKKVVDEPKAGCEKGTPQMRAGSALSRKSPMNRQPKEGGCGNLYQEEFFKADRSVSYEKSKNNKKILKNALTYVCLAGEPNKKERDLFIQRLEQSDCEHVILLFKAYGRMDVKALYGYNGGAPYLLFSTSKCPQFLNPEIVKTFFKYDSGAKQFKPIDGNKQFTIMVDAVQLRK